MKYLLFLILFFSLSGAIAQQYKITGKIVEESGAPVPFANAALYSTVDSTLVTGAVSDDQGLFAIPAAPGKYFLNITFLSYQEKTIPNIQVANRDVELGSVILRSSSELLEEIVVQGEKSQMELYLDKRVFQVGKDLSNISSNATDILDNVPSVTVDVDGNVSLRGSGNVRILIDGKPSGLTGINTADALRQLQGNLIESIEVITNPSARYDAEGEVGIINIILKKNQRQGVNGSVSLNAGYPDNYGASYSMNFRREKMNFFSSYGYNYRANPGSGQSFQRVGPEGNALIYDQRDRRERSGRGHNFRVGTDYFFNDKNTLTGSFLIRNSDGLNTSTNEYRDYDEDGNLLRTVIRNEREEEPEINTEFALSYRREYDRKGRELTADFKWIENIETEEAMFNQTDDSDNSLTLQQSYNTEDERNVLFQLDYIHPFAQKGKFEAGLKSTLRIIDNEFWVKEQDEEGVWNILDGFDNRMVYTENIHAGYLIVGNEFNKFSWQAGVRGEYTDIAVEFTNDSEASNSYQKYFNVFPSAHLSYKFTPDRTIQLSYSYRLSRPWFRELLPFSGIGNIRSIRVGNPNLRPEYTHSIETGYLLNWETGSLLSSVYYRYRTGVRERVPMPQPVEPGEDPLVIEVPVNLAREDAYGLEFNFSWSPNAWFRFNSNANFYRAIRDGFYEDRRYFRDTYTWTNRTTARFTFAKKWDFQTGFNYRAPQITTQGKNLGLYTVDLGLSRDILKGNGTLTLSVRDLFNSRKWRYIIDRDDLYSEGTFQWRARQTILTFTYRINKKKERQNGGDQERNGGDFEGGDQGDF